MFRSLRFRLAALFLAGIVLAGVVATAIAFGLFASYSRGRVLSELRREGRGLARLYSEKAGLAELPPDTFERATGDLLFYVPPGRGISLLGRGLKRLPASALGSTELSQRRQVSFEFTPRGETRTFLAVATPVHLGSTYFGSVVVAQPRTQPADRLGALLRRLVLALLGGVVVAGAAALYLSRRITRPVLLLSAAADEVAKGRYDVAVPDTRGRDEVAHLAERFREMATRLGESEELERNFLMSVSHELRTPLTAIRGHVAALREGLIQDPELQAQSLAVIESETQRLERLVGDVLDLAKLEAKRFTVLREEVDMERLLTQAYDAFAEQARKREIEYRREITASPVIVTDGDRVLQIISNLLANAFRWTPDGGRVDLALTASNGTVSVAVGDTGPGIAPAERERIFRPFWSRDDSGTGLGLAIARELAAALGGRIELRSEAGAGSRFELVLPARPA